MENALRTNFDALYHVACRLVVEPDARVVLLREAIRIAQADIKGGETSFPTSSSVGEEGVIPEMGRFYRALVSALSQWQGKHEQRTFEDLEAILRDDPTDPGPLGDLDPEEKDALLWDLEQGCLTAVIACLSPGERVAFVLLDVMGLSFKEISDLLGVSSSALRVRASRARGKVVSYLNPRCGLVDSRNPCHCPSRLGVAIRCGFVAPVKGRRVTLREVRRLGEDRPTHDPLVIFHRLPAPKPPEGLLDELLETVVS